VRLLVTRPEPDGERTAEKLRARGHDVVMAPLLRMDAVDFEFTNQAVSAVVMTSANAARAVARHRAREALTALTAFTVGRHTAEAARAAGFGDIRSADGAREDLIALIAAHVGDAGGPLLYLAGEDRAGELDLAVHGLRVFTVIAYRAVKVERFPPAAEAALRRGEIDGVLHFSRRSAQTYLDCAARADLLARALAPAHLCLSRQISEPLAAAGAAAIRVASRPEEAALLVLLG
jgi:uroporphyrinogen-III synthase